MGIDAIISLAGLIIPPAADFIKKKFIKKEQDTPERTVGSLATTKPEVIPNYIKGLADMKRVEIEYYNRDVIGKASPWVVNLRASIRPIGVIAAMSVLVLMGVSYIWQPELLQNFVDNPNISGVRYTCEAITSSWFGDRIRLK